MFKDIIFFEEEKKYLKEISYAGEITKLEDINKNKDIKNYYCDFSEIVSLIVFEDEKTISKVQSNRLLKNSFQETINTILFSGAYPIIENPNNDEIVKEIQSQLVKKSFSWLKMMEKNMLLSDSRVDLIVRKQVDIELRKINKSIILRFVNDAKKHSIKVRDKIELIESDESVKMSIFEKEEIIDIIENEERAKQNGDDITSSPEIRRASILRDNANIIQPYPIKSVGIEAMDELENLKVDFPNFSDVINDVMGYVYLSSLGNKSYFQMKPVLLAGDPGVGKTAFAQKVSKILGLTMKKLPFPTISASWVVTGLDLSFRGGKQGKLFDFLSQSGIANPIIFLDELDKAKQDSEGGNPLDILHDLLEAETSVNVIDEAMNLGINASKIIWIATANHLEKIPSAILSRFKIYEIKDISCESQKIHVIKNVYKNIVSGLPNGEFFDSEIDDDVAIELIGHSIRTISNMISGAISSAGRRHWEENRTCELKEGKIKITKEDL